MTNPTREVELKAVVHDLRQTRHTVEDAGGRLVFAGRLEDRRYDSADHTLAARDEVIRLRTYRNSEGSHAHLDWKGPTQVVDTFKVRDELTTGVSDPDALAAMLGHMGYVVIREIDRDIVQYVLYGTTIRFERYPRMDTLVEVEGTPDGIEAAILVLGIERSSFTTERLPDFVRAYESRTGLRAALSERELAGEYRYSVRDA
ncbi:MAG: class IV adenylate cyclase [Gemmatimonadaceae bacterium]